MTECELAGLLAKSKKYSDVCEDTLVRVARWSAARHPSPKGALKAAKRKLHQITGAYVTRADLKWIEQLVERLEGSSEMLEDACRDVLAAHASTRERLPHLRALYRALFEKTGPVRRILDLACGLNPFSLPWMDLSPGVDYTAVDIDAGLVRAVSVFLRQMSSGTKVSASAFCADVLALPRSLDPDLVLLLKAVPSLEQQEKGMSLRLLTELNAAWVFVSFPTRSLGGRDKGMSGHYGEFMRELLRRTTWQAERFEIPTETCFLLRKEGE